MAWLDRPGDSMPTLLAALFSDKIPVSYCTDRLLILLSLLLHSSWTGGYSLLSLVYGEG